MDWTPSLRFFFYVVGGLFLANLLVMNEVTTLWDGAESAFTGQVLQGGASLQGLPQLAVRAFSRGALQEFLLRLPGVLVLILSLAGFFFITRPLFGLPTAWWTVVVMGSSFLIPTLAKIATIDVWSFSGHLLGTALLLRYIKQPRGDWRWLTYSILALSVWVDPLKSLIYFTLLSLFIWWGHPQGRALWRLQPWLALLAPAAIGAGAGRLDWGGATSIWGFHPGRYALFLFVGMLPFFGWWLAGCWDTFRKASRREELALLNSAWIGAALLSQSAVLAAALSLLAAKQLLVYFEDTYPFRGIVKTGAVLHLIGVFFLAMALMLFGFIQFGGPGFRAALAFGGGYWVLSLLGVIGLYGSNRGLLWGATVSSGLIATFLFWLQINPLLESRRDVPKRLAAEMLLRQRDRDIPLVLFQTGDSATVSNEWLYLRSTSSLALRQTPGDEKEPLSPAITAKPWAQPDSVAVGPDSNLVRGWNDRLQPVAWLVRERR